MHSVGTRGWMAAATSVALTVSSIAPSTDLASMLIKTPDPCTSALTANMCAPVFSGEQPVVEPPVTDPEAEIYAQEATADEATGDAASAGNTSPSQGQSGAKTNGSTTTSRPAPTSTTAGQTANSSPSAANSTGDTGDGETGGETATGEGDGATDTDNTCNGDTGSGSAVIDGDTTSTAAVKHEWGNATRVENFDTDLANWNVYRGPGHAGKGQRSPSAMTLHDGVLTINGDGNGTTGGMAWNFGSKYGRWEGRVRAPASDPSYNALLLLWPDAKDFPIGGEIDFMEMTDHTRQTTDFFLHYGADNAQVSCEVEIDGTQWHNWAVEWTPSGATAFVDGEKWWSTTDTSILPPGSMHLCIQLDWFPEGSSRVEASQMMVDWVAFYPVAAEGGGSQALTTTPPSTPSMPRSSAPTTVGPSRAPSPDTTTSPPRPTTAPPGPTTTGTTTTNPPAGSPPAGSTIVGPTMTNPPSAGPTTSSTSSTTSTSSASP
jgi:hypothetical protein